MQATKDYEAGTLGTGFYFAAAEDTVWTFSMVECREMGHWKPRGRGSPSPINHLATSQSSVSGSLKCFSRDPVEEPVSSQQHNRVY